MHTHLSRSTKEGGRDTLRIQGPGGRPPAVRPSTERRAAGLDGSREIREILDAADWAAREAERRPLPLCLPHAGPEPDTCTRLPEIDRAAERHGDEHLRRKGRGSHSSRVRTRDRREAVGRVSMWSGRA